MQSHSAFPTVGESVLAYVGSGASSRPDNKYVKVVSKNTQGRGSSPTGTTGHKSGYKINEATGPKCRIVSKLYKANAAAASETQRNVRILKPATGASDFWSKRQYGSAY